MPNSPHIPRYTVSNDAGIRRFQRDGFIIVRGLAEHDLCQRMRKFITNSLRPAIGPLEYEADVHYPGSPASRIAQGGDTTRRLLNAYSRDAIFRNWATSTPLIATLSRLLVSERIMLSQNHHNCIMTKHPGFSSETHWHQDIRYWSFDRPELITVWLALGDEHPENGGLSLIPGSHRADFDRGRFDAALFLREDLPENRSLIDTAQQIVLGPGDVLYFHCRTLHAAGKNTTDEQKFSLVFTYSAEDNQPIPGTRSARYPDIEITTHHHNHESD